MSQKIQAVGTFLYKLDDQTKNNLWSGSIQPNNGHDPIHAQKAAKLFAAAEDLLAMLKEAREALVWYRDHQSAAWCHMDDLRLQRIEDAIAKAEQE